MPELPRISGKDAIKVFLSLGLFKFARRVVISYCVGVNVVALFRCTAN